jgi:hypothetical protein
MIRNRFGYSVMQPFQRLLRCVIGSWTVVAALVATAAAQTALTRLEVSPPDIALRTRLDRQSFVVTATLAEGITQDVTSQATLAVADPKLVRLQGPTVYPLADGQTSLAVTYGGQTVSVPIVVQDAAADRPISFKLDVMPIFVRAGCNTGSCHGAARGKDGFNLSLFGYNPDGDHYRLTREIATRRIDLSLPRECLLIEKASGAVPHTGGKRFAADSEYAATLVRWLEAGAPADPPDVPHVLDLQLFPQRMVLQGQGTTHQLTARAKYSDGTDRDVTNLAVFLSNNDNSAAVSADGLVTARQRGEAFVLARFETFTVGSQVIVLPNDLDYARPAEPPANYIDQLVNAKLHDLRIVPSGLCSDEIFLRRARIDITGLLPTPDEYEHFLADPAPDKRPKLVDRLLARKEFSEIWAMKWAELPMIKSSNQMSYKSMFLHSNWLTDKIANNVPIHQMVEELLSATGGTFTNPPTNYYQIERDTLKTAENVAQVFMGIRIQCAQCHNHPFDRWTMNDYYSFAAFFSQIGRKGGEDYRETIVFNAGGGDVQHPVGGRVMPPKFLGGEAPNCDGKDRRAVLARWITSPQNPFFATSIANRIWAHFFGIGIVEPVDDIRVSNPPTNPELFHTLGQKLIEYNYDFKRMVRDICTSNAYQRATARNASNASDELNFSHAAFRRIRAESLLDCISQVTGTQEKFQGLPLGARAVQIADGRTSTYFLTTFGRAPRETVCAAEVSTDPTLSQALHLLNGPPIEEKIRSGGMVKSQLAAGKTPEQVIQGLYVRCLSRKPTPGELEKLLAVVQAAPDPQQGLEDVFWGLLNSREFMFNH